MLKARVIAWFSVNAPIPSNNASAYCQARQRLPEKMLQQLFGIVAQNLEKKTSVEHLWCGRHVKVVDGSTVSMPDTSLNQVAYPQSTDQALGCGFPEAGSFLKRWEIFTINKNCSNYYSQARAMKNWIFHALKVRIFGICLQRLEKRCLQKFPDGSYEKLTNISGMYNS